MIGRTSSEARITSENNPVVIMAINIRRSEAINAKPWRMDCQKGRCSACTFRSRGFNRERMIRNGTYRIQTTISVIVTPKLAINVPAIAGPVRRLILKFNAPSVTTEETRSARTSLGPKVRRIGW